MKKIIFLSVIIFALFSLSFSFYENAKNYKVNKTNSIVEFKVDDKLGTPRIGYFDAPRGIIQFDQNDPQNSKFKVSVYVKSLNTNDNIRDKDLLSPNFLDASRFPLMTFDSKKVIKTSDGFKLIGDLKIKDVTKEVTIPFVFSEQNNAGFFRSEFKIKRSDFGVGSSTQTMGNDVDIKLSIAVN